jgi:cytochrome b pre-mRNA-processing protein 3
MIARLFTRRRATTADAIYQRLVEGARDPAYYVDAGVADDVEGRIELLMLHVSLAVRRLAGADAAGRRLASELVDRLFEEVEIVLRERSFGDKGLAKRLSGFGDAFYGRLAAYGMALAADDRPALVAALRRNLFADGNGDADGVAAQAARLFAALTSVSPADLVAALDAVPPFAPTAVAFES